MRSLLILAVVLACTTATLAIVCPPDACSRVHCPMDQGEAKCLARGTSGQFRYYLHGGFCGCCNQCIKLLQLNESCLASQLLGVPFHAMCADGLKCETTKHVCVKA